jgi:alpha-amylase
MKTICLYFQVHQPFRFRRYRFFDIGESHYYYDDFSNESIMKKVAGKCYLPANQVMLDLIEKFGDRFKITYSISGLRLTSLSSMPPRYLRVLRDWQQPDRWSSLLRLIPIHSYPLPILKSLKSGCRTQFKN